MTDIPDDVMTAAFVAMSTSGISFAVPGDADVLQRRIARAIMAERERCAAIADDLQYSADAAFDERVRRARKGERHLELAAATAAGMSHSARKAAITIRKGDA